MTVLAQPAATEECYAPAPAVSEPSTPSAPQTSGAAADLASASARGVRWNVVQNLAARLGSLVVVSVLTRILDRSAFGVVAIAGSLTVALDVLANQGLGDYIVQRETLDEVHVGTAFWMNAISGLLVASLFAASAPAIAASFAEPRLEIVVYGFAITMVLRAASVVPTALLSRRLEFRSISMRSVLAAVVGGGVGIVAALAGLREGSLVLQSLAADAVALATLWVAARFRPPLRWSMPVARELLHFGLPIVGAALLAYAARRLDTLLIGGGLGAATLAAYALAQRIFEVVGTVVRKSGDGVAMSAFSRVEGVEARRDALYMATELAGAASFPVYLGLVAVSRPLTEVAFSQAWAADASDVLAVFALAGIPITASSLHVAVLKSNARTRLQFALTLLLALVYIPALAWCASVDVRAAAWAYTASLWVVWPFELLAVRSVLPLRVSTYLGRVARPLAAALLMFALVWALELATRDVLPAWARLVLEVPLGILAHAVALRWLSPRAFPILVEVLSKRKLGRRALGGST